VKYPATSYARVGADYVAYQTIGRGSRDIVVLPGWFSSVEAIWDLQPAARFLERIASLGRLILFDRRGIGLSDPPSDHAEAYIERSVDDLIAVLDAAGSATVILIGCNGAGPVAVAAAATTRVGSARWCW
jgi:pimeloyl-ACP methyl ester carboxylesterase